MDAFDTVDLEDLDHAGDVGWEIKNYGGGGVSEFPLQVDERGNNLFLLEDLFVVDA